MGAFLPVPGQAVYGATKAALELLTEARHAELLDTSVGVSVVMSGAIATDIAANPGVHLDLPDAPQAGRALPADRAAHVILDGLERDDLRIVVGSDAKLMILTARIAPEASIRLIQKKMKNLLGPD